MRLKITLIIFLISITTSFAAVTNIYSFVNKQQEQQFNTLISNLRCLVCQNENIADSNAALAKDLRNIVYSMTRAGKNESEIKNYLVNRYSDYILFKPPVKISTLILWFSPFVIILLVIGMFARNVIASGAKPSKKNITRELDCFVANAPRNDDNQLRN